MAAPELWRQPCLLDGVSSACALCTLGGFAATEVQAQDKGQITGTQTGGVTRTIITQMDVPNSNYVTCSDRNGGNPRRGQGHATPIPVSNPPMSSTATAR